MAVWETVLGAKWIERLYRLFLFIFSSGHRCEEIHMTAWTKIILPSGHEVSPLRAV